MARPRDDYEVSVSTRILPSQAETIERYLAQRRIQARKQNVPVAAVGSTVSAFLREAVVHYLAFLEEQKTA